MGFTELYDIMMGYCEPSADSSIKCEFTGECERLYGLAVDARIKLTKKLDGTDDGENKECMIIVESYEKIMRILCERAYEYGRRSMNW